MLCSCSAPAILCCPAALTSLSSCFCTLLQLDNTGTLSTLYETKLATGEKVAGSLQLQGADLSKPVKYGFSLDLS